MRGKAKGDAGDNDGALERGERVDGNKGGEADAQRGLGE